MTGLYIQGQKGSATGCKIVTLYLSLEAVYCILGGILWHATVQH